MLFLCFPKNQYVINQPNPSSSPLKNMRCWKCFGLDVISNGAITPNGVMKVSKSFRRWTWNYRPVSKSSYIVVPKSVPLQASPCRDPQKFSLCLFCLTTILAQTVGSLLKITPSISFFVALSSLAPSTVLKLTLWCSVKNCSWFQLKLTVIFKLP